MKIAGFSFIRNAELYDYPINEAIQSVLPLCDVFYLAVGNSDDNTLDLVESIGSDKIHIIPTIWDDSQREGGKVLALETDKAFQAIPKEYDWCFYIQGDEIFHEKYHEIIRQDLEKYHKDAQVEGILFNYLHFYGSYDYVGTARNWYRHEIRIIRNDKQIASYKDAQGFRKNGRKLRVAKSDAFIYHYGWVKHPDAQKRKLATFNKLWHDDEWVNNFNETLSDFDYSDIDALARFEGTHPKIMQPRIDKMNWNFDFDPTLKSRNFKQRLSDLIERFTGWRIGEYKNYRVVRS